MDLATSSFCRAQDADERSTKTFCKLSMICDPGGSIIR